MYWSGDKDENLSSFYFKMIAIRGLRKRGETKDRQICRLYYICLTSRKLEHPVAHGAAAGIQNGSGNDKKTVLLMASSQCTYIINITRQAQAFTT